MASQTQSADRSSPPHGVKIVCASGAIGGVVGMYDAIASFRFAWSDPILTLAVSLVQLVVVGLWERESWGWILGMVLYGAGTAVGFIDLWDLELWSWVVGTALYGLQNPNAIEQLAVVRPLLGLVVIGYLAARAPAYR